MEERDAMPTQKAIVKTLIDRHGRTFSRELGIDLGKNTPSPVFRWLCFSMLASARISADIAMAGAKALAKQGWTTADKMADSTWRARTDTLNHAGYARYDESTSRMLGDTATMLLDEYGGDLRQLRERAARDPKQERKLLKQCKGIGDTGASIFLREVQASWDELYPFADKMALKAAGHLGLGDDGKTLARRVDREEYPRFVAALIRTALARDYDEVLADASRS
jgi:thermostable 8-oxoguanine DNA glycosylase